MYLPEIVSNWFNGIRKYLLSYNDGFYEIPFISNSPELIVASFSHLPFMKHDAKKQVFYTSTLFLKGTGHYQKIDEGLWVILSEFEVRKNLSFKLHHEPGIESKYHSLSLYINKDPRRVIFPKVLHSVDSQDHSWFMLKAGSKGLNSHFKGQRSIFINIYFTTEWMQKNVSAQNLTQNRVLTEFFNSPKEWLYLSNLLESKKDVYMSVVKLILEKGENGVRDALLLRSRILELLSAFVNELNLLSGKQIEVSISERDMRRLKKAEYLLSEAIFDSFPSISVLASKVGISETKLKADFKAAYGCTLYHYFIRKKMAYAKEMIRVHQLPIKEVAFSLGYTHPGKFSEAYKKIHGQSPSVFEGKSV